MAAQELDSRFDRVFAVTADKWGIDPLRDKVMPSLLQVTAYTNYVVKQDERGAPDLVALRTLGSEKLYWIVMAYNGISSWRDIIEGISLRIPNLGSITNVITENTIAPNKVTRVITI